MKKIISYEEKERKTKINQIIIGLLLISLMIFSTIGFAFSFNNNDNRNNEKIEYNGIEFVRDVNGYWNFELNGNKFYTLYNPEEISDIKISVNKKLEDYNNKPLYFVGDVGEGFSELYKFLSSYAIRIGNACLEKNCKYDYPIKSCDNDNIIIIEKVENDESIIIQKNCVYIKTKDINEAKYADAYIFNLLGIR